VYTSIINTIWMTNIDMVYGKALQFYK